MGQVTLLTKAAKVYECPKCHSVSHNPNDVANFYCGRCHKFLEDLRNERVRDFEHITKLYLTRKDCFTLALLCLFDAKNPDARLVHAEVLNSFSGKYSEHAWVEMPATGTYEDGSQGPITVAIDFTQLDERVRFMPTDAMYEAMQPRNLKHFTLPEAMAYAKAAGHDGPWDLEALAEKAAKERPMMDALLRLGTACAKAGDAS